MAKEPFRIIAVCTGNTCRSPFVEGYLRHALRRAGLDEDVEVTSAGIFAANGHPATAHATAVAQDYGVDLSAFRSQPVTEELIHDQHLILTLEETHEDYLLEHFPELASKIRPLGSFIHPAPLRHITDPVGGDLALFEYVGRLIVRGVDGILESWDDVKNRYFLGGPHTYAIGSDHRGYELKQFVKGFLTRAGVNVVDAGTYDSTSCDHPDYAFQVGELVATHQVDRGILICSSGHGMVIAVNKVQGVRGVVPINREHCEVSRHHNNANVLCLAADYFSRADIEQMLKAFMYTDFLGGKYQRRINKISRAERVHETEVEDRISADSIPA